MCMWEGAHVSMQVKRMQGGSDSANLRGPSTFCVEELFESTTTNSIQFISIQFRSALFHSSLFNSVNSLLPQSEVILHSERKGLFLLTNSLLTTQKYQIEKEFLRRVIPPWLRMTEDGIHSYERVCTLTSLQLLKKFKEKVKYQNFWVVEMKFISGHMNILVTTKGLFVNVTLKELISL